MANISERSFIELSATVHSTGAAEERASKAAVAALSDSLTPYADSRRLEAEFRDAEHASYDALVAYFLAREIADGRSPSKDFAAAQSSPHASATAEAS